MRDVDWVNYVSFDVSHLHMACTLKFKFYRTSKVLIPLLKAILYKVSFLGMEFAPIFIERIE